MDGEGTALSALLSEAQTSRDMCVCVCVHGLEGMPYGRRKLALSRLGATRGIPQIRVGWTEHQPYQPSACSLL